MDERLGFYVMEVGKDVPEVDGGIFTLKRARLPFLTLYILVEDIEAMADKVVDHGGFLLEGVQKTPGGSKICLFNEPSGVTFAMIEKKK
jgi:predicted enzyme related to lactoylglutathione lyase